MTKYREVKRRANVGERIKVTSVENGRFYSVGDIGTVTGEGSSYVWVKFDKGKTFAVGHTNTDNNRYVVLEPIVDDADDRIASLEKRVAALEAGVKSLTGRSAIGGMTFTTLKTDETIIPLKTEYTREQVVEMAKKDVEELTKTVYEGDWETSKIPKHFECGPLVFRFRINRGKRSVAADGHLKYISDSQRRAHGTSVCAPDDCFNLYIGKAIALRRALGLDVPDYYTNAPKPTEAQVGDMLTFEHVKGAVYAVIDEPRRAYNLRIMQSSFNDLVGKRADGENYNVGTTIIDDSHDFGGEKQ